MAQKKESKPYVFISYKREEIEEARKIKAVLEEAGFTIWWDEDIQIGQVWSNVLDEAVKGASCIVVLWSKMSLESRWVMHEASSAMDRDIYAPVRIAMTPINPPYNRHQATDLIDWDGNEAHPGIIELKNRVQELIPEQAPLSIRAMRFLWRSRVAVVSLIFAAIAISLLLWQSYTSSQQIKQLNSVIANLKALEKNLETLGEQQSTTAKDIERSLQPMEDLKLELYLEVKRKDDNIIPFLDSLNSQIAQWVINGSQDTKHFEQDYFSIPDGSLPSDFISLKSNYPYSINNLDVRNLVDIDKYTISLFKVQPDPQLSGKDGIPNPYADLTYSSKYRTKTSYYWDVDRSSILIYLKSDLTEHIEYSNGSITSLLDITKSMLNLQMRGSYWNSGELEKQEYIALRLMKISTSKGQQFLIKPSQLEFHKTSDGLGYYSMGPDKWKQVSNF